MSKKGIIYICTTSVEGLIKIGRTDNFNSRMNILEQNGYWNVSGLKRFYAVRVDDYIEKEKLIHTIFSKSQVANSELFALDKNLAKEMLDAFEGEVIYPEPKKEIKEVSKIISNNDDDNRYKQLDYTKEDRLAILDENQIKTYNKFEKELLKLENVSIIYRKYYAGFLVDKIQFLSIIYGNSKKSLIFTFNLKQGNLNDSKNICRDVSHIGHLGNGEYEWVYSDNIDYNYIWNLIMQCYNAKKGGY